MMFDRAKFDAHFFKGNLLFHYTTTQVALEHILFENRLRISPRKNSRDPIENSNHQYSFGTWGSGEKKPLSMDVRRNSEIILSSHIKKAKQLSFCKNGDYETYANYSLRPLDYFGCFKPRMWEQYGDNYSGVCLVFDREKLELNKSHISGNIKYVGYNILDLNEYNIDLDRIIEIGEEKFIEESKSKVTKNLFNKHLDYSGENEFRIMSFCDNQYDYIKEIKKSLFGILISNLATEYAQQTLKKICEDLSIPLVCIDWSTSGIYLYER
ncbi:DUF2971 domain-containing protein [Leeuwenhoekiella polynyae]|uniref:DUF2971 domain-containing protein n=1 Tax=Leeuwenhoekiella polynyae TaxID=1550906 RepID=A0A4Q0PC43_9FLAO|nr:DUF2971 domain-containing protein [Leeuwenhoekiella polynyae]RXG23926.1 hypothetical protein DSM02_1410 [Leeuwenhoekiella polynyae]